MKRKTLVKKATTKKTNTKAGVWTCDREIDLVKELSDKIADLTTTVKISLDMGDASKTTIKQNIEIIRELTQATGKWELANTAKISLIKLQQFELAAGARSIENDLASLIQTLAASLKINTELSK